ncbi:MAG: hypothetical protein J5939_01810 [Bacteroidales bacterium]|nr:hypothetical protein [Bacteroidales bacterium]
MKRWAAYLLLPLAVCCGRESRQFHRLETAVETRPDSVLTVLEGMERPRMNEADRSAYDLLYARAFQAYYSYANTSLEENLGQAAAYYDRKGPVEKQMQAQFLLGKTQQAAGNPGGAIVSLLKAERAARRLQDHVVLCQTHRLLARIHEQGGSSLAAIRNLDQAMKDALATGDATLSRTLLLEYAQAFHRARRYDDAESAYWNALYYSHEAKDTLNEVRTLESYASMRLERAATEENADFAIESLGRVSHELGYPLSCGDMGVFAYAFAILKNRPEAAFWLGEARRKAETPEELEELHLHEYQVFSSEGNTTLALEALEKVLQHQQLRQTQYRWNAAVVSQMDYLREQEALERARLRASRMRLAALVILFLAILATLFWFFRARRLQNLRLLEEEQAETERYMSIAEDLQSKVSDLQAKVPSAKSVQPLGGLDALDRLCEQYYVYEGTSSLQPKILKEVKSIVEGLRSDPKVQKNLEQSLDERYGGVMRRLRAAFPKWREEDFLLYAFTLSGFSNTTISTLLEKDKPYVYNRLYRIKERIKGSGSPDAAFLLSCLEK